MITINKNYKKLQASYLFSDIAGRLRAYQAAHPEARIIKLGIGDVTRALPKACVRAFQEGVNDMSVDERFHGYGPEQGYDFLRELIAEHDFASRGADIGSDEIFISDGAKCDSANFQELFNTAVRVAVPDPVYPVYVDTNVMAGRTDKWDSGRYQGLLYLESVKENNFIPAPPQEAVDLIYLCFPNNPTGATAAKEELRGWIDYAHTQKALILYDAAYEAYIRDDSLPRSIFEIDGAAEVAVEFRSFSKTAGFTGTRCAYTVVPKTCRGFDSEGNTVQLHALWNRRQSTKFNGVSYPVQKAAAACYSEEGKKEIRELTDYYLQNAAIIREKMTSLDFYVSGGINSPYLWIETGRESWGFFQELLENTGVVTTPGSGFGRCGEGYIRISAFNHRSAVETAMEQIEKAGIRR
jgi:LL-diaminopimelate aminotransferase